MDDTMCQTRAEIISEDPQLQKAQIELRKLRKKEGNGTVRREILEYELLLDTRIAGIQTQQDVKSIKSTVEDLCNNNKKYPTVLYQLTKMPIVGWSMMGSTILGMWLIAQLGPGLLISILKVVGFDAQPEDVNVVVAVVMIILFLNALRKFIELTSDDEESGSGSPIH